MDVAGKTLIAINVHHEMTPEVHDRAQVGCTIKAFARHCGLADDRDGARQAPVDVLVRRRDAPMADDVTERLEPDGSTV